MWYPPTALAPPLPARREVLPPCRRVEPVTPPGRRAAHEGASRLLSTPDRTHTTDALTGNTRSAFYSHTISVFLFPPFFSIDHNVQTLFQHQHKSTREDEETEGCQDEEAEVDKARLRAQEAVSNCSLHSSSRGGEHVAEVWMSGTSLSLVQERQYREAILRDASQLHTPSRSRTKPQHQPSTSGRRRPEIRRLPSSQFICLHSCLKVFPLGKRLLPVRFPPCVSSTVRVRETELLPLLLEELPHLDISSHTQGRMWQRQKQQVDRLGCAASPSSRRPGNLGGQVGRSDQWKDLQNMGGVCVFDTSVSLLPPAAGGSPEEARPAGGAAAQRPRTQKTPGELCQAVLFFLVRAERADACMCHRCGRSAQTETLPLPEGAERAQPAAEVHPEQSEGAQTAGGTRKEVLQRARAAPCTSDEDAHKRREGER